MLSLIIISITCYALPAQLWPLFWTRDNLVHSITHCVVSPCNFITCRSGAFVIVVFGF